MLEKLLQAPNIESESATAVPVELGNDRYRDDISSLRLALLDALGDARVTSTTASDSVDDIVRELGVIVTLPQQIAARYLEDLRNLIDVVTQRVGSHDALLSRPFRTSFRGEVDTLEEALFALRQIILWRLEVVERKSHSELASRVNEKLPVQKDAPLQFGIVDGVLRIIDQPARGEVAGAPTVNAAREGLLANGRQLLEAMSTSNCDQRVVALVNSMQTNLEIEQNVIQLGLLNLSCEALTRQFAAELPDTAQALLIGYSAGIRMLVAQYPEWVEFADNAAAAELTEEDALALHISTNELVAKLREAEGVDPSVPDAIAALNMLIANAREASKRAVFAMLRTMQNFVSAALKASTEFVLDIAKETRHEAIKTISKAIVLGLLALALAEANVLAPLGGRVADAAWVKQVIEDASKYLEALKRGD